jgi:hypothetical protein
MTAPAILTEETLGHLSLGRNLFCRPFDPQRKQSELKVRTQAGKVLRPSNSMHLCRDAVPTLPCAAERGAQPYPRPSLRVWRAREVRAFADTCALKYLQATQSNAGNKFEANAKGFNQRNGVSFSAL